MNEFWQRLAEREVEDDLRRELERRASTREFRIERLPAETVIAVAARVLPGAVPPEALAAFLDEHYDRQLGRGDEKTGLMPRDELIPTGFSVLDTVATVDHGTPFAALDAASQDELLTRAEKGDLAGPMGFDSATWFKRMRGFLFLGYGSNPRGMVEMGFPGPSYKPGHVWLDEGEVAARIRRRPGYRVL